MSQRLFQISDSDVEIERRYTLESGYLNHCHVRFGIHDKLVRKQIPLVDPIRFKGTDYYRLLGPEEDTMIRLRTGNPVNGRLCIKTPNNEESCNETEVDLGPDVSESKAISFIDALCGIYDHALVRKTVSVEGLIYFHKLSKCRKIEVALCIAHNPNFGIGKAYVFGEIEAHGFDSEESAVTKIREMEERLGWSNRRTFKRTAQTLPPDR